MNTNEAQAMQASFPWLTALILVALLGAVALWAVKPARKAALPFGVSLSALIFFAFLAAAAAGRHVRRVLDEGAVNG